MDPVRISISRTIAANYDTMYRVLGCGTSC